MDHFFDKEIEFDPMKEGIRNKNKIEYSNKTHTNK